MPYTYRVADTNFDYDKTYMLHYIQIYQTYFMKPGFYYPGFHDHNLSYVSELEIFVLNPVCLISISTMDTIDFQLNLLFFISLMASDR